MGCYVTRDIIRSNQYFYINYLTVNWRWQLLLRNLELYYWIVALSILSLSYTWGCLVKMQCLRSIIFFIFSYLSIIFHSPVHPALWRFLLLVFQKLLVMLCSKQVFIQWYKEYCLRLMMDTRKRLVNWKLQFNLLSTSFRFLLGFIDVLFSKCLPKTPDFSWLLSLNKQLLLVFK